MPNVRLLELSARSFGVIDDVTLEFGEGLNVLTGETGAGKTLLLGALDLCLGGDGPSRTALNTETRVATVFLDQNGAEQMVGRESSPNGRLRALVNGQTSSSEALRLITNDWVSIFGQHDALALRQRNEALRLVDEFGDISDSRLQTLRTELRSLIEEQRHMGGDAAAMMREQEFARFQFEELSRANLQNPSELDELLEVLTNLTALQDSREAISSAIAELDGEGDSAVFTRFAKVISALPRGTATEHIRTALTGALEIARESVSELLSLIETDALDEQNFAATESRVTELSTLARKYGGSLSSAIEERNRLQDWLEQSLSREARVTQIENLISDLESEIDRESRQLRQDREFAATQLTEAVRRQLPRVALPSASLRFAVDGDDGSAISILFRSGPGLPEGPIQDLASGGELSRILLAIGLETAPREQVAVYDEIDAGIGGQVAQHIGDCLAQVAINQQVLVVTHLASVAARAQHHFVVEKSLSDGLTKTAVRRVAGQERVREIARMLAGDADAPEALALAEALLSAKSRLFQS